MGIDVQTPADQLAHIPTSGPVIITLITPRFGGWYGAGGIDWAVRKDYKILTRSLLTDVDQIADFMIQYRLTTKKVQSPKALKCDAQWNIWQMTA